MGRDCKSRPHTGWRLILDTAHCAADNMAIDEAIMLSCADGSAPPTVRIYSWTSPSISLGCLQALGDGRFDIDYCRSEGIDVVRRITGGRAVIHGSDVTFSIALREADLPAGCSSVLASHHWLMGGIVNGLRVLGIESELGTRVGGGCADGSATANADCFAHIAECDVRIGRKKAVGSAQVRRHGAILEQGSIPYSAPDFDTGRVFCSPSSHEEAKRRSGRLPRSVTDDDIPLSGLAYASIEQALAKGFEQLLNGDLTPAELTADELELARQLARDKYATEEWTLRQNSDSGAQLVR